MNNYETLLLLSIGMLSLGFTIGFFAAIIILSQEKKEYSYKETVEKLTEDTLTTLIVHRILIPVNLSKDATGMRFKRKDVDAYETIIKSYDNPQEKIAKALHERRYYTVHKKTDIIA